MVTLFNMFAAGYAAWDVAIFGVPVLLLLCVGLGSE